MSETWKETFNGYVKVTVTGRLIEQFINGCVKEDIKIWDIRRLNKTSMTCKISLNDIKAVKRVLKATDCRIHFRDRQGFPFFIRKALSRKGVIGGMIAFLAVLFILSNMVWNIRISGADPKVEHNIQTILKNMDIHRGVFQFSIPSIEQTEYNLSQNLKNVTWVGVSIDGTSLNIKVVQKSLPKQEKVTGPQNLYAKKEAVISHLFVEKGQPMVKVNDYVKKGDLLVSGQLGTEEQPKFVAAKGEVIGETWYHSQTSVPLNQHLVTYTGNTYEQDQLGVFGLNIPIWGFRVPHYKLQQVETINKPFHFLKWTMPLSFDRIIHRESKETTKTLTKDEAINIGKRDAKKELMDKLPKDAKIISENIWRTQVDNGIVKLIINYVVNENIVEAKPIIQGD